MSLFLQNKTDWSLQQTNYEYKRYTKTNGDVFCISGCQDTQTSADAYMDGQAAGALSYILLNCLHNNSPTTYKWKHLLKDICCGEKVYRFEQRTALTSGNPLNLEDTVFITSPALRPAVRRNMNSMGVEVRVGVGTNYVVSLARNLNYNTKIKKLYIKYK